MDGRARLAVALAVVLLLFACFEARAQMSSAEVLAGYQAKLDTIKDMWLKSEIQNAKGEKFQAEVWLKLPNKLKLKITGALDRATQETFVMDGTTFWGQVTFAGGTVVYKMDQKLFEKAKPGGLNSLAQVDLRKALQVLKQECAVAIGFSVRVDGKTMHVLNARTKPTVKYDPKDLIQASLPQVKSIKLYVNKEDMLLYRVGLFGTDIKPFLTITAQEVKTNTALEDTLFKYTPPKGAAVLDLTKLLKLKGVPKGGAPAASTTARVLHITGETQFKQLVLKPDQVALVDFWAPWCGPCRKVSPIIDRLASDYAGRAVIAKVNTDTNRALAGRYNISAIPTVMVFKDGEMVEKLVGTTNKTGYCRMLDKHITD